MREDTQKLDFLLGHVCHLYRGRVHALFEELGLYRGQPPVLHALWEQEGLTHSELAARLHVQPATMTKMIRRMERAGFVERCSDPADQRVSRVYLTPAGRAIRVDVERIWERLRQELFEGFTLEEQVLLRRFLLQIRDNLLRVTASPRC